MSDLPNTLHERRNILGLGLMGAAASAALVLPATSAYAQTPAGGAQSQTGGVLRTVLDRGRLIVGTGSTNAPWHFEDDKGKLTGMDIAMGRILAKGLFDDETKVDFVKQDPSARLPNIVSGKVDVVIQFMTMSPARAQLIGFSRPYYVEGVAMLTATKGKLKTRQELVAAGNKAKVSVLQNVDADGLVKEVLPKAQVMQLDTQANVIQALDSGRVDAAAIDLSTVGWLVKKNPTRYIDSGLHYRSQLYGAGMRINDQEWINFVNVTFNVAMHGHQNEIYDAALNDFMAVPPPERKPGFPRI